MYVLDFLGKSMLIDHIELVVSSLFQSAFLFILLFALFSIHTILFASFVFHSEFAGLRETAQNLGLGDSIEVQVNRWDFYEV